MLVTPSQPAIQAASGLIRASREAAACLSAPSPAVASMAMRLAVENAHLFAANVMLSWCADKVREERGDNRGPIVDAIQLIGGARTLGESYCLRACYAAWRTAAWTLGLTVNIVDGEIEDTGGCARAWVRSAPRFRLPIAEVRSGYADLRAGDIMIRVRDASHAAGVIESGRTAPGHAELVIRYDKTTGRLITAGGNTSDEDSAEGNGFFYHDTTYTVDDARLVGFLRPVVERNEGIRALITG